MDSRPKLTHFISVPVNDDSIIAKFNELKKQVQLHNSNGINQHLFQKEYKLHLTFGVLVLKSDEELTLARNTLQECQDIINKAKARFNISENISFKVKGVTSMNENAAKGRILYGKVESEILQTIADEIVDLFVNKSLMQRERENVKLHVTVANVSFLRKISKKFLMRNFDASAVIEKFAGYEFGEQQLNEIHLSKFGGVENGYYLSDEILNVL